MTAMNDKVYFLLSMSCMPASAKGIPHLANNPHFIRQGGGGREQDLGVIGTEVGSSGMPKDFGHITRI